ncbi:hypothetical protein J6590_052713 [Homalodisca vitripennis]|nr:hypothetical protein J6590_052713 [Homalodisca vitripennis]
MKSSPSDIISGSAPYNPILSSSVQEEGKNILDPTLFKTNRSTDTPVGCRYSSAGRARAFNFGFSAVWADSPHQSPMGIRTSSEQPENQVASAERVRPLRTVAAAGKQLSIQAENNQYFDGVTPPPTDKSGRGGKAPAQPPPSNPKQNLSPTERRTNKLWHRIREVENPNRKRSPEQEADKTRSS